MLHQQYVVKTQEANLLVGSDAKNARPSRSDAWQMVAGLSWIFMEDDIYNEQSIKDQNSSEI